MRIVAGLERPDQGAEPGRSRWLTLLARGAAVVAALAVLAGLATLAQAIRSVPGVPDAGTLPHAGATPGPAPATARADTPTGAAPSGTADREDTPSGPVGEPVGTPTGAAAPGSPPLTVTVPGHLADTPVDPVTGRPDGSLDVPDAPTRLGWWALGGSPGAGGGTVLLAGHLDSAEGPGPFEALHDVPIGARVRVASADGARHGYRVVARRTHLKAELPSDLFRADGARRLVLVTCAGDYDPVAGAYTENLVLYAVPAADG
ncbi:sortase [Streptomyces sp. LP05-1]|uniref:Sortase n=1 Tax=Streptomyces pyxinae TaxID=2970734 RepID=A0ABT2CMI4_9ACTN|nr:class F sortase [Streptomyces sp. LP05-1]MCS0638615.1 sortase [Streptomyces sp. LP05-1]